MLEYLSTDIICSEKALEENCELWSIWQARSIQQGLGVRYSRAVKTQHSVNT